MTTELTRRDANAWRAFFSSEEGRNGMAYIMERRPTLTADQWQQAAGFEKFKSLIEEIQDQFVAGRDREDRDELKL